MNEFQDMDPSKIEEIKFLRDLNNKVKQATRTHEIDFGLDAIPSGKTEMLVNYLMPNEYLTKLTLKLANSQDLNNFIKLFGESKTLKDIVVRGGHIDDQSIFALKDALEKNAGITSLDMSFDNINVDQIIYLFSVVKKMPSFQKLTLRGSSSSCALRINAVVENPETIALHELDSLVLILDGPFDNRIMQLLSQVQFLGYFTIKCTKARVKDNAILSLIKALEENKFLVSLNINFETLDISAFAAIARRLQNLETLELTGIFDEIAFNAAPIMIETSAVQSIKFNYKNPLPDEVYKEINKQITELFPAVAVRINNIECFCYISAKNKKNNRLLENSKNRRRSADDETKISKSKEREPRRKSAGFINAVTKTFSDK
jgi:hypothetical protein